ncbi:MAG: peroxide stress protein YaaA [Pseudomonadota bacterium]
MLVVISPAKSLDFETPATTKHFTQPDFLEQSADLIGTLRKKSRRGLANLMNISDSLAELNRTRYHDWTTPFTQDNAKQAVLAFTGDTYQGLQADQMSERDLEWAQDHLRILSGLYGVLRPLDLMQPYRLEMGTRLKIKRKPNLYKFWGSTIAESLNAQMKSVGTDSLINLASNEYFKSVDQKTLSGNIITPVFKDKKGDDYKMIGFFAKKARGMMGAWIIKKRATKVSQIKRFTGAGYKFNKDMSSDTEWVFTREAPEP